MLAAAAVGLVVRLAFGLGYWVGEHLNRDEVEYLSLARSLAAGQGYKYDPYVENGPVEPFGRAPGYPAFLALVGGGASYTSAVPDAVKIAANVTGPDLRRIWGDPVLDQATWKAHNPVDQVAGLKGVKLFIAAGTGYPQYDPNDAVHSGAVEPATGVPAL